jgi:hypothetical protein
MKRALLIASLFLSAMSAGEARPGCVYTDANLFTSPAYLGGLIGTIPAPAPVEVVQRGQKWSLVSYDGESGYIRTRRLSPKSRTQPDPPPAVYDQSIGAETPFWSSAPWTPDWKSRTYWSRQSQIPTSDPAWAACGGAPGGQ